MRKYRMIMMLTMILISVLYTIYQPLSNPKPRVVVVLKEIETEYWKTIKIGAQKAFRELGLDGNVIAPKKGFVDEQNKLLEKVFEDEPDVIIFSPIHTTNLVKLEELNKNNIPVLLVDTDYPLENKRSFIGTNHIDLGRKVGLLLATTLQPEDKVVIIHSGGDWRMKAKQTVEEVGVNVASQELLISTEPRLIKQTMERIIRNHPDVKGLIAETDIIAVHAFEVIENHGLKIPVIGVQGNTVMIELVKKDAITSTVAQNPYDIGYVSIQTAMRLIKEEEVIRNINTGIDIITKENADMRLKFLDRLLY